MAVERMRTGRAEGRSAGASEADLDAPTATAGYLHARTPPTVGATEVHPEGADAEGVNSERANIAS